MGRMDRGDLDRILELLAELDGSDLHIKAGAPPRLRVAGSLRTLDDEPSFTDRETLELAESIMEPRILEVFNERHEVDFAYSLPARVDFGLMPTTSGHRWPWPCGECDRGPQPSASSDCPMWSTEWPRRCGAWY